LEKADSTIHSHTPFVILLLQYLAKYKAEHGKYPEVRAEKEAFKSVLIKGSRNAQEENFAEAHRSANKYLIKPSMPSGTRAILADRKASNITADSSKFWILANALKGFVENEGHGALPLMGSIPDMTATTNFYIGLQKVYQEKAARDVAAVEERVNATLEKIGNPSPISHDDIKKFCKNSSFLQVLRYRSLEEERTSPKSNLIAGELNNNLVFYVVLRAADSFYTKNHRLPGSSDDKVQSDVEELKGLVASLLSSMGVTGQVDDKYIKEIVRFGGAELHNISSVLGGIASQEIIKIITHQYTPMDNTFIFNGMDSTSGTYSL